MNENRKEFTVNYGGKLVTIETGRMAKQADGAVFISCEGTQLLATVVSAKEVSEGQDFFPLLVDYKEKFYAAGKFLGGFQKREGRPSNAEILLMRMVDRPFRPLFPEGYMFETTIQTTVLSHDHNADPEILAGLGAAAALAVSDVPFNGPVGFCKVGRINGQFVLNPTAEDFKNSDIELVVAGTRDAILMIEGEANELPEEVVIDAILFAQENIKSYCEFMDQVVKEVGKEKRTFTPMVANKAILEKLKSDFVADAKGCLNTKNKLERYKAIEKVEEKACAMVKANLEQFGLTSEEEVGKKVHQAVDDLMYYIMRKEILDDGKRIGGRSLTQVRQIETEVEILKRPHGSSLFTRGETQVLATVTLGGKEGEQLVDTVAGVSYQRFYLHYTFAPFCVGEAKGYRGVGRREIGHGNLAERALRKVLPPVEAFPYTARVSCEVLESNGSSSMGSICSGSMALMDAGVPLKAPVAGVAMGLIKEGDKYAILTDILGDEDHLGDMDFKVGGTEKGITAVQMDIKISGLNREIFEKAMAQAREGRLHILGEMAKTIRTNRVEFRDHVPRMMTMKINPEQIGMLIGPSGRNIKALQEEFKISVEVQDDGTVKVLGPTKEAIQGAMSTIALQLDGPKVNQIYEGKVVTVKDYGVFVDIAPNVSGLVHVSEMADERVRSAEDYVKEGDIIQVKVLDVDRFGKIKLSAKAAAPLKKRV